MNSYAPGADTAARTHAHGHVVSPLIHPSTIYNTGLREASHPCDSAAIPLSSLPFSTGAPSVLLCSRPRRPSVYKRGEPLTGPSARATTGGGWKGKREERQGGEKKTGLAVGDDIRACKLTQRSGREDKENNSGEMSRRRWNGCIEKHEHMV